MQEPHPESAPHQEGDALHQLPAEGISLVSKAWLRHGPKGMFGRMEQGQLMAREERVSLATREETVFEADRHEIRVNWPWWEFGAGVHLTVSGKTYRLSFARPPEDTDSGIGSIGDARAAGKAWKEYLSAQKAD
jgi:hypothetical protein